MTSIGNKEILARNLMRYIEQFGITQKEMAEVVGVAASTLNDWVKAKKYPRIDKIEIMANYFGCEKSDLIEDKTEKPIVCDGLSDNVRSLVEYAKTVPEDKAELILRVMKSILESD